MLALVLVRLLRIQAALDNEISLEPLRHSPACTWPGSRASAAADVSAGQEPSDVRHRVGATHADGGVDGIVCEAEETTWRTARGATTTTVHEPVSPSAVSTSTRTT